MKTLLAAAMVIASLAGVSNAVVINFDDVIGSDVDITTRYVGQGVTLNAIVNPFPLAGPFPAPATLPSIIGGVTTWTEGFRSATSGLQVAVAADTPQTPQAGDGGILISFAFDVTTVSLVGNDLGTFFGEDDESVTLTAYDAAGNRIGQAYTTVNLPGSFDQTPATISGNGIRYVAFNYTDSQFGFYAIDDLNFRAAGVPDSSTTLSLLALALASILGAQRLQLKGSNRWV
jgi:hypothetical protein